MAVLHRALLLWAITIVFLIFIVLRLDERITYNWFLVFIPLWLYDAIVGIVLLARTVRHWRSGRQAFYYTLANLVAIVLKLLFQLLLCLHLEYDVLNLYHVVIPLWLLLVGVLVRFTVSLVSVFVSGHSAS